jgi:hypothetical protein
MAMKKTILAGRYLDRTDIAEDLQDLDTLTGSQKYSVDLCLIGLLPANVRIEQRSAFGPIDVIVDNYCFKVNQRAKITQRYENLAIKA